MKPSPAPGTPSTRTLSIYVLGFAMLAGIGLFNFLIDPYLFFDSPRIDGINRWKPAFFPQHLDTKAQLVRRSGTSTLIVGTSTAGGSLDPGDPALRGARVFNLAIAGSSPRIQRIVLQHAARTNPLRELIVCVDLFAYNEYLNSVILEASADRLPVTASLQDSWLRLKRSLEVPLIKLFSYRTLADSAETLRAQEIAYAHGQHKDIRADGFWSTPRIASKSQHAAFATIERQYLAEGWFPPPARRFALAVDGRTSKLDALRGILADAHAAGISVTIAIMPSHARLAEAAQAVGLWQEFDELKRQIVTLANDPKIAATGIRVWDFSGYNSITMDPVRDAREDTPWFHDSIHPSAATGTLMLYRMFASAAAPGGIPADFGRELTPDGLDSQLAEAVAQRGRYLQSRAADVEDVKRIVKATRAWREPGNTARP